MLFGLKEPGDSHFTARLSQTTSSSAFTDGMLLFERSPRPNFVSDRPRSVDSSSFGQPSHRACFCRHSSLLTCTCVAIRLACQRIFSTALLTAGLRPACSTPVVLWSYGNPHYVLYKYAPVYCGRFPRLLYTSVGWCAMGRKRLRD